MCYCMCSGNSFFCCKISDFDTSLSILRRNKSIHGFWISAVQKKVFIFLLGKYIKVVQGVSHWNEQSNLALTGIKIDNFIDIMCSTNAWGYDILTFVTIFQKSNIGWPQQPPTERVSDISKKNWIFDDSFLKKGPVLVILAPGMIRPSGSGSSLVKWGCWGHWGHWGYWGHWGCRSS